MPGHTSFRFPYSYLEMALYRAIAPLLGRGISRRLLPSCMGTGHFSNGQSSVSNEAASEAQEAQIIAWVRSIRKHKTRSFLDVNDGSSPKNLQAS
ncbi:hypothetical protein AAHC03_0287 [Spirometra sp. Aus1]